MFRHATGFALAAACAAGSAMAGVSIAFPRDNATFRGMTNVYCIGAVETGAGAEPAGAPLCVNGAKTEIYRTGAFLAMVPLVPGTNRIEASYGGETAVCTVAVLPPLPQQPAAETKPRNPRKDLGIPEDAVFDDSPPRGRKPQDMHIMVDPGHGGKDTGAISPHGYPEKDANLKQALAIRDELARAGFRVTMTREDDSFPPLYSRPKRAWQEKADAFVSVHHNATAPDRDPRLARHTVTYASNEKGLKLAAAIQKHVARETAPVPDSGAQTMSLAVCRNPAVPSCLVEVDFINLPEGEEASWDPARMKRVARAVTMGILDWMMAE